MATHKIIQSAFKKIKRIVFIVSLALAIFLGLVYTFQEHLIFMPTKLEPNFRYTFKAPFEEIQLTIGGNKIDSLYFKSESSKKLILYFHGNAGNLDEWGAVAEQLRAETHASVLIMDYPGYGKSEGHIHSEEQLHEMASAFMKKAMELADGEANVIIYGRSIGTGLATELAAQTKPAALILESPYFSLERLAVDIFPQLPSFLLRYKLRSNESLPQVQSPVLIFHGTDDEVIPFAQGLALSKTLDENAFVPIQGGHHNDLSDSPLYHEKLVEFFSQL